MRALDEWYAEYHDPEDPLVVILPDFESFSTSVLQDFIMVLRYLPDMRTIIMIHERGCDKYKGTWVCTWSMSNSS